MSPSASVFVRRSLRELWDLEDHLTRRLKEINYKYDSRGSRLTHVLGKLLYYDAAKSVQRNRDAALYWYTRAYRRGDCAAAYNIGVLRYKEKQFKRVLAWFLRAVKLGEVEANIEIGKHYLHIEGNPRKAIPCNV